MDFKNRFIFKFAIGFSVGMLTCTFVTSILTTADINDGNAYLCDPGFTALFGNELTAFLVQCLITGLYGALCISSTSIYEIEKWSLLKATVMHFFVIVVLFTVTAFSLRWIYPSDIKVALIIYVCMAVAYFIIWIILYLSYKREVRIIREDIEEFKNKNMQKD